MGPSTSVAKPEEPEPSDLAPDSMDLPSVHQSDEDESDLTRMTVGGVGSQLAEAIVWDEEAALEEPTAFLPWVLLSAAGQTDRGLRRRRNEDSYIEMNAAGVFVVADGMGGHKGGAVASKLAVDVIRGAFENDKFQGPPYSSLPRRASELAQAIQAANREIFEQASRDPALSDMGTTVVASRFVPNKQRLYLGHVGDSRCYRIRNDSIVQMTTDHTMANAGIEGPFGEHLTRSVGIEAVVQIDVILAKPQVGDRYLLCSDGLFKMASELDILEIVSSTADLESAVAALIERANNAGGRDNVTVILVAITRPRALQKAKAGS
jgi:PPM family protein phosphatase